MPLFVRLRCRERALFFLGHRGRFDLAHAARRDGDKLAAGIRVLVSAVLQFWFVRRGNLPAVAQLDDIWMDATAQGQGPEQQRESHFFHSKALYNRTDALLELFVTYYPAAANLEDWTPSRVCRRKR